MLSSVTCDSSNYQLCSAEIDTNNIYKNSGTWFTLFLKYAIWQPRKWLNFLYHAYLLLQIIPVLQYCDLVSTSYIFSSVVLV